MFSFQAMKYTMKCFEACSDQPFFVTGTSWDFALMVLIAGIGMLSCLHLHLL